MQDRPYKNRIAKYWCVLLLWFFLSLFISPFLHRKPTDELVLVYLACYTLFLIVTFMYEGTVVTNYLRSHFPMEAKRLSSTFYWNKEKCGFPFLLSFSPEDVGWKRVQSTFKKYLVFLVTSLLSWLGFAVLHLLVGAS